MRTRRPYLFGVWAMLAITLFRIAQVIFLYLFLKKYNAVNVTAIIFKPLMILFTILPPVEAIIYWNLRYRIQKKTWVRIHVWSMFTCMVAFPILIFFVNAWAVKNDIEIMSWIAIADFYIFWFLMLVGHVFFIATIVRYFNKKTQVTDETPAGLLDEFLG
jgi:hypothetical protein